MPGKIFISYRRDDDPAFAARVRDGLAAKFGKSALFMDVDNLLAGQRFDDELAKALKECDVLVAIMGAKWIDVLAAKTAAGEHDYVREEVAAALQRRIVVIPVRVGRDGTLAPLPRPADLPDDIRELVQHQKHDVVHEKFRRDVADLASAIATVRRSRSAPKRWPVVVGAVAAIVGLFVIFLIYKGGLPSDAELEAMETARQQGEAIDAAVAKKLEDELQTKNRADAKRQ